MKEQVREIATEVWQTSHWTNEQIKRLESFYSMVRNAALEEAAQACESAEDDNEMNGYGCAANLRNLKEPTP